MKGSEYPPGDPRRKHKGRIVFQGNDVWDENHLPAIFNELSSSPATLEASKIIDALGLMPGCIIEQADAKQAYCQAELGSTVPGEDALGPVKCETWVRLPLEFRPTTPDWANKRDPVCRLKLALYGI